MNNVISDLGYPIEAAQVKKGKFGYDSQWLP